MTSDQKYSGVGDSKAPALRQPHTKLEQAAGGARIMVDPTLALALGNPAKDIATVLAAKRCSAPKSGTCLQTLWFSFFFDGTGNNLDADLDSAKHSNVARLYRAHRGDENNGGAERKVSGEFNGIYRFYVPGIGTYFKAIGDNGGSGLGLGAGAYGMARLEWAAKAFDLKLSYHAALARNAANGIVEVNISAFGFSRGAALARAFIHKFVKERCLQTAGQKWILRSCGAAVRIRFLGLFDTVASVGLAASANNMEKIDALVGDVKAHISNRLTVHRETRPEVLAFSAGGAPGADPVPGRYDGHSDWGGLLMIPEMVEDVRHFVAAHELRNSFPLDSISILDSKGSIRKPAHFHEYVYPGVHSDVGGSYRPGEGGKSEKAARKIGLVPLHAMYGFALSAGVPLLTESAFSVDSKEDFRLASDLRRDFNLYLGKLADQSRSLGEAFNANMKLYYAWRFSSIRHKRGGDRTETVRILKNAERFESEIVTLQKEIDALELKHRKAESYRLAAEFAFDAARDTSSTAGSELTLKKLREQLRSAELSASAAKEDVLTAKARMLALPKTSGLPAVIEFYDNQLIRDAQAIYDVISKRRPDSTKQGLVLARANLRPHYKILLEAYEDEFIKNVGLKDEFIKGFFENYIHDSLAGFGKDGTLPSDPRVIYIGNDEKLRYAELDEDRSTRGHIV